MGYKDAAWIQQRIAERNEPVFKLTHALIRSAHNHHLQAVNGLIPNSSHHGGNWYHCSASSCSDAWAVLFSTGHYNKQQRQRRLDAINRWKERILNGRR